MTSRRALILVLAVGAFVVTWAVSRYAIEVSGVGASPARTSARAADDTPADAEKITLRFFRNPAPAPTFTARDLDGRSISTSSFRGKVVLINFWATWCPPCRAEIPDLVALQEKYRDQLQVIGVSEDEAPPEDVKRFAVEHKMNYPVVMTSPELQKRFPGVSALPTSFVLDRDSQLVQKHVGM